MTAVSQQEQKPRQIVSQATVQQDLFPLKDSISFRDDNEMMALPFFSISKAPRSEPIEHRYVLEKDQKKIEYYVRVTGGEKGIANIWDNDLLIYLRTILHAKIERCEPTTSELVFNVYDFLKSTGRDTGSKGYDSFHETAARLQATTVHTNIAGGDFVQKTGFSWLLDYQMQTVTRRNGKEVNGACRVKLCDWMYNAAIAGRYLSVDADYFKLTGALERKLWLVVRKHLGKQSNPWQMAVDKVRERCASQSDDRHFRHDLKKLVEKNPFPEFLLSLSSSATSNTPPARGSKRLYLVARHRHSLA